jgi:predicted TIM-barrel fold metal-dependent hydrolase
VRDYRIFSVDDHLVQPPTLWQNRLPAKYVERGPRVVEGAGGDLRLFLSRFSIKSDGDGNGQRGKFDDLVEQVGDRPPGDAWVYDGEVFPTTGSSIVYNRPLDDITTLLAFRYSELEPELYEPVARTRVMDEHGVLAAICFPMSEFPRFCGQSFLEAKDKELALECVRAFNDWMVEDWAGGAPGRLIPLIIVPLWDPHLAAAEIERAAAKGARAIAFSEDPYKLGLPSIHDPGRHWDPVFAAAQDAEMPLCTHIGSASWTPPGPPEQPFTVGLANTTTVSTLTCYEWLLSDVFVRFPRLRLVLSEGGIGWLPHALEHADYVWHRHGRWTGTKLPEPPSSYFPDHVYGCFIDDIFGAQHIREIGVDNVMLETDFPHSDSSYTNTLRMAEERLAYLDDDELEKVTRGNAMRVFGVEVPVPPLPVM